MHLSGLIVLLVFMARQSQAQARRWQRLELVPGWNAVFLEVDPPDAEPSVVFADLPVDVLAAHSSPRHGSQFISNPGADLQRAYGWAVWYSPSREDHILSNLYAVQGGRPYLIHATTNATVDIMGEVPPQSVAWTPNAYNFVGFSVDDPGGPTFGAFFQASPAHNHNRIYRLVDGTWRQVTNPAGTLMRAGEAFWIYTQGRSSYAGPLEVSAESPFGVQLVGSAASVVTIRNRTAHPVTFSVAHIVAHNDDIPLAVEVRTYDEEAPGFRNVTVTFAAGGWEQSFPTLEAGAGISLPLRLDVAAAPTGPLHSLLRVRSDMGTVADVPISALRDEPVAVDSP